MIDEPLYTRPVPPVPSFEIRWGEKRTFEKRTEAGCGLIAHGYLPD